MKVSKILAAVTAAAAVGATLVATASAYNAYIGVQTTPYSFRNSWDDGTYGLGTGYFEDYMVVWGSGDAPEETFPAYADNFDWDINGYAIPVDYTDATVNGDGTYTVSMDGFDWSIDGASAFNFVIVSTDIPFADFDPNANPTAFVKSASLVVDGQVTATVENPPIEGGEYLKINVVNIWNTDCPAYNGAYPTDDIAVEFTIEGLGGAAEDAGDAAVDTTAPTTGDKQSPDTGVEGVAAVAGLAVLAGGAMLISKKRK